MDIFASALEADETTAPSQYHSLPSSPNDCCEVAPAVVRTDDTKLPSLKRLRRFSRGQNGDRLKRKMSRNALLQLIRLEMVDGNAMPCVFVDTEHTVAVPLWRQYRATWKGTDFDGSKFIVVGTQETWVPTLLTAVHGRKGCLRDMVKTFVDRFRREFLPCLVRGANAHTAESCHLDSSSEDSNDDTQDTHRHRPKQLVDIMIGGFTLTCINTKRRATLKLDAGTVKFISEWLVPLARQCPATTDNSSEPLPDGPVAGESPGFQLSVSSTPNIRDKVTWNPTAHSWILFLKHPKGQPSDTFAVDHHLTSKEYAKRKDELYWRAVRVWNELDSSKRFRIPCEPLPVD